MHDPDVIARIDGDAGHRSEDPVVRQRLRPERIDLEGRGLGCAGLRGFTRSRRSERLRSQTPPKPPRASTDIAAAYGSSFVDQTHLQTAATSCSSQDPEAWSLEPEADAGAPGGASILWSPCVRAASCWRRSLRLVVLSATRPAAHEIPADVLVQLFVKPEPGAPPALAACGGSRPPRRCARHRLSHGRTRISRHRTGRSAAAQRRSVVGRRRHPGLRGRSAACLNRSSWARVSRCHQTAPSRRTTRR